MAPSRNGPCLCGSGGKLKRCCLPIIEGAPAKSPVTLLRARYVAYGLGEVAFLIASTDPRGSQWHADHAAWERDLRAYCAVLRLGGLAVAESSVTGEQGFVRYEAKLVVQGRDVVLAEAARYRKDGDRWLYTDGDVSP